MTEPVRILDGNSFMISRPNGDVDADPADRFGLFSFDTRFLSRWRLTVNGEPLNPMSVDAGDHFQSRFFLVPGAPTHYVDADLSVIRERSISSWLAERLIVLNHGREPAELALRVEAASDFASMYGILFGEAKGGSYGVEVGAEELRLCYARERFRRETLIVASEPADVDDSGLTFRITVPAHGEWRLDLRVEMLAPGRHGGDIRQKLHRAHRRSPEEVRQDLAAWLDRVPRLNCDWAPLRETYRRSLTDMAALRYRPLTFPDEALPAAGLPWYMVISGRDSLITSLQSLAVAPELAATTLRMLGVDQGSKLDDFRDEEPGKIMREFRYGEATAFGESPNSPYFGSADTTPLYVMLMDEYERWTGDDKLVREYEPEARAALAWIDEYGDVLGNGYVSYLPRNERSGIVNQVWKEFREAICYADGRIATPPLATCELQGYAYDAKRRGARMAREIWGDSALADRLEREADDLRDRFNRDFWIADRGYYALALDRDGNQVDALASNMGHLLMTGILPPDRAAAVAEHLMAPSLYSGWGVRSLATTARRYNPLGYHLGAVWPFDNSLIAWGLRRYGFDAEAARIAEGMLQAGMAFGGRLPEAFGGYDRALTRQPVNYPSACSPHAWSTGAAFLLLRTLLGLKPAGDELLSDPAVPASIERIDLLDVPGRWGRSDAFARGRIDLTARWPSPGAG
ncbi:glycogen debranching N-terminal domain-containing protein [Plantactinospora siamensis]|uniref:Glycogen debranching N-terminal domain-containing protein n=1 Tax=Plantactinospora siamensis TaxID=555372 RepID=A0ABV6NT45_9ACTN